MTSVRPIIGSGTTQRQMQKSCHGEAEVMLVAALGLQIVYMYHPLMLARMP